MIVQTLITWGEGKRLEVPEDQQLSNKILRCYRDRFIAGYIVKPAGETF